MYANSYFFDDVWPSNWKEFSGEFDYLNFYGLFGPRNIFFDEKMARIILLGYENFGKDAERMLVHCKRGNNCSLAVGIAMNGVFGWEINGLKERFPNYRRFVYKIMMDVGKGFRNI